MMNRLNDILDEITDNKRAIKGRLMWEICIFREIINKPEETQVFYIIGLD